MARLLAPPSVRRPEFFTRFKGPEEFPVEETTIGEMLDPTLGYMEGAPTWTPVEKATGYNLGQLLNLVDPGAIAGMIGGFRVPKVPKRPAIKLDEMVVTGKTGETHLDQFLRLPKSLQEYPKVVTGWVDDAGKFVKGGGKSIRQYLKQLLKSEEGAIKGDVGKLFRQLTSPKSSVRAKGFATPGEKARFFARAEGELPAATRAKLDAYRKIREALVVAKDKKATVDLLSKGTGLDRKFLWKLLRSEEGAIKLTGSVKPALRVGDKVYTGETHMKALSKMPEAARSADFEVGYSRAGEFLAPEQITELSTKAGIEVAPSIGPRTPRGFRITGETKWPKAGAIKTQREFKAPPKKVVKAKTKPGETRSKALQRILEEEGDVGAVKFEEAPGKMTTGKKFPLDEPTRQQIEKFVRRRGGKGFREMSDRELVEAAEVLRKKGIARQKGGVSILNLSEEGKAAVGRALYGDRGYEVLESTEKAIEKSLSKQDKALIELLTRSKK